MESPWHIAMATDWGMEGCGFKSFDPGLPQKYKEENKNTQSGKTSLKTLLLLDATIKKYHL